MFPQDYVVTKDNMESFLQGNFVGHVLLTFLLFELLDKNEARIINLSSLAHTGSDFMDDSLQKLCDEKYNYIKSAAVHPGAVNTEFMRFVTNKNNAIIKIILVIFSPLMKFLFKTPIDGAQTQLNLCYIPFNEFVSGAYYSDCKITKVKEDVNDMKKVLESMKLTVNEIKKRFIDTKIFDILNGIFDKD